MSGMFPLRGLFLHALPALHGKRFRLIPSRLGVGSSQSELSLVFQADLAQLVAGGDDSKVAVRMR